MRSFYVPGRLRALAVLAVALAVSTCRDALGPGSGRSGRIAVAPILPSEAALADVGLIIDAVRFVVVRPQADTLADTTIAFPPGATELALNLRVPLISSPETLSVSVVALSGSVPLYVGTRLVQVPTPLPPPEILVDAYVGPARLLAAAGDAQLAAVATSVGIRPAVRVVDSAGSPVPGVGVTFTVASGGGGVTGGSQMSDATGTATVGTWTLGTAAGTNTLTASAAGLTRTFTANGVAGTATQLVRTAGDLQSVLVGLPVGVAPAVRAQDQYANPVAGALVTFVVSGGGGGAVFGATQLTNAAGVATVGGWTLDTLAGTNALTVTSGAVSTVFTVTGLPAAPDRLLKVLGDGQAGVVNAALAVVPTVRLIDRYGNAIAGDTIDFLVLVDGGFVATPTAVTEEGGQASAGAWTLANFVTQNALQAGARGTPAVAPVQFTANGIPDIPAQLLRVSVDTQTALAGQAVSVPPAVQVVDQYFNAVPGAPVAFTLTGSLLGSLVPDTATTDSTGVARVTSWALDILPGLNTMDATAAGLAGSPVTFSANGITTTATNMVLEAGDLQSGIVATLLPIAYSVVVKDAAGLPVQNVHVHWGEGVGGGSMNPSTSLTDVNGVASSTRTLGFPAGTQTATASVGGLTGSPVTFTATASPGAPAQLIKQSADPQTGTVATTVTAPVVKVADQFGNGVSGISVAFSAAGGGAVGAAQATSDGLGFATPGTWTLDSIVGTNTVAATAGTLPGVSFTATSFAGPPARLAFLTEPTRGLAGDTIEPAVRVVIQDQFGNTVPPATDVVNLGLSAMPDPAAKLVGTVDVAAVNGVAVFPNLAIDSAGIGYTLRGATSKLPAVESNRLDVGGVIAAFTGDRLDPVAAAFNPTNGFVYVPGVLNTLGVLDPSKGQFTQLPILQSEPFGVAVNALTNRVYVTTFALLVGAVAVIDARDNSLLLTIPLGGEARGIAVDEATDRIFVAVAGDPLKLIRPSLAIIDGKDNRVVASIPFPEGAQPGFGVAFNPVDRLVYVAIPNLGVGIFDPATEKHVATVPIVGEKGAAGTFGVAADVRTRLVYATNRSDSSFSVIDPSVTDPTRMEIDRVRVGDSPEGLGIDADRGLVFVTNSGSNTVSFLALDPKTSRFTVFATLVVGPTPKAAAVDPGSGRVYVPTFEDDRVRVVQP